MMRIISAAVVVIVSASAGPAIAQADRPLPFPNCEKIIDVASVDKCIREIIANIRLVDRNWKERAGRIDQENGRQDGDLNHVAVRITKSEAEWRDRAGAIDQQNGRQDRDLNDAVNRINQSEAAWRDRAGKIDQQNARQDRDLGSLADALARLADHRVLFGVESHYTPKARPDPIIPGTPTCADQNRGKYTNVVAVMQFSVNPPSNPDWENEFQVYCFGLLAR